MTINEFNAYLKDAVTDEMFETLVLSYIRNWVRILCCHIDAGGNKIYSLQDNTLSNEYYLIIDICNSLDGDNYDADKYMIARKDEETLFLLASYIWGCWPQALPVNVRCLMPFLNGLDNHPEEVFNHDRVDFSEHIFDKIVSDYDNHGRYIVEEHRRYIVEQNKKREEAKKDD